MPAAKVLGQSPCRAVSPAGRLARPNPTRCRHCGESRPIKARGLCRPCWGRKAVRRRYAPWERTGELGRAWEYQTGIERPAPGPTATPPGPAKVRELARRHAAGLALFADADAESAPVPFDEMAVARIVAAKSPGVHREARKAAGAVYRARPWVRTIGRHLQLGTFPNAVQAALAVLAWEQAGRPVVLPRPAEA